MIPAIHETGSMDKRQIRSIPQLAHATAWGAEARLPTGQLIAADTNCKLVVAITFSGLPDCQSCGTSATAIEPGLVSARMFKLPGRRRTVSQSGVAPAPGVFQAECCALSAWHSGHVLFGCLSFLARSSRPTIEAGTLFNCFDLQPFGRFVKQWKVETWNVALKCHCGGVGSFLLFDPFRVCLPRAGGVAKQILSRLSLEVWWDCPDQSPSLP